MSLLEFRKEGIYCPQADVYIDPWRPVKRALITHGHADHSRWGHQYYLCTTSAMPVIRYRLGDINVETIDYGEKKSIHGVQFSFHPAGHILGSAQIRIEYKGEVWVVSGDYKIEDDGFAEAYEPVQCHSFITECTFGLPIYKWKPQQEVFDDINSWWQKNKEEGKVSVLSGYSLGKAQRIIQHLDTSIGQIYTHGAVENVNEVIRSQGVKLQDTIRVHQGLNKKDYIGNMVICPPSAMGSAWIKKFKSASLGVASGWMMLRGARRRRAADRGFVLSDHVDWEGLNTAIEASGAERIFVTHGYTDIFRRWLAEEGYDAQIVETEYEGELTEMSDKTDSNEEE
ncbi:MAG: ligase-associated DNA damage response exonuclease [Saprospiraceae bacterium]|nr:ligase-associated DNA damage response exonuclease [Saprospiraceae bacterium]